MNVLRVALFLSILIFVVSGCASTSSPTPTSKMTDKIEQSEATYNDAVNDVVDLREDLDGYDLGI